MPKPAFIVDGFTEQKIIQQLCRMLKTRIVRNDLNGKTATIPAMATRLSIFIEQLKNYHPIIILVDREKQPVAFDQMSKQLKEMIVAKVGIRPEHLIIGVADEMIENWMIAEDGVNAKKRLGKPYKKTTDGVDLFTKADPSAIYANCPSFRHFVEQLDNQLEDIDCHYLNFNRR